MAEELLINVSPFETRVALVSHGLLQEIHVARAGRYSVAGNIYLGKVERIVPGMQAAFVNIGLKRPGFLHARDIDRAKIFKAETESDTSKPDIRNLLHEGQSVLVQVEKDPIASKGARLSTQLALVSKYLVFMPNEEHVGISQRIDDEEERERLRMALADIKHTQTLQGGVIARTAGEGVGAQYLRSDLQLLQRIWTRVSQRAKQVQAPSLVYDELPLHSRVVRDLTSASTDKVFVDDKATFERIHGYIDEFLPTFTERLCFYQEPRPLFERHGVEDEILRALKQKVTLKSGGTLVIEQTEAMISIDVNTGGFLGGHSLEETVFRANMEAAAAVPRQLRLRNLGGIVVIDFIDMEDEEHQRQVLRTLEKSAELDPARTRIEGFSNLGLVQMSRKRTRESLAQSMCTPCKSCSGVGLVRTAESTCVEVLRGLSHDYNARCRHKSIAGHYLIRATESVVDRLLDEDAQHLAVLSQSMQRDVRLQVEPCYREGQFDIVLVQSVSR
ncbi:MAG: Rne/Rng family ribonuclease [Gammaproteobacteria bacterium]|nr:Rne/Rng family ribonuclease [Gammaproteobacteria bacterium]